MKSAAAATSASSAAAAASSDGDSANASWEDLKKQGTDLYLADDFHGAMQKYLLAAKALEAAHGDEPEEKSTRQALAVLYTNRAMAALQLIKREQQTKTGQPVLPLPQELRKLAMRANVDASNATELDETNAKAYLRKGQALLWMSAMPQRAKEAMYALEKAQKIGLPASMKKELDMWLQLSRSAFNEQTPMPENCPQM